MATSKSKRTIIRPSGRLESFLLGYKKESSPLPVSIRDLVPEMPYNSPRYTHGIHFYPAKLIPQIPALFLDELSLPRSATILDPFCGSGTVLLESVLRGHRAIGADSNPLARLISEAKTTVLSANQISRASSELPGMLRRGRRESWPDVVNLKYWFSDRIAQQLAKVRAVIEKVDDVDIQRLLWVSLSQAARRLSKCDLRVTVPVRLVPARYPKGHILRTKAYERTKWLRSVDPVEVFLAIFQENLSLVESLLLAPGRLGHLVRIYDDSCSRTVNSIHEQRSNSVDLIITSPPYAGAQKYVRASSLGLGWTGLCDSSQLRSIEDKNVGREHYPKSSLNVLPPTGIAKIDSFVEQVAVQNPVRAKILNSYFLEMDQVITECKRVLTTNGHMVLVAGPNQVCGLPCDTPNMLLRLALRSGLEPVLELVDEIRSRGLMTRRNKTASTIVSEHLYLLKHAD